MAASVRKIYVDSRFGVGPSHQFTYELAESVTTNEGAVCYVTGFSCPISFLNVTQGVNDHLYLVIEDDDVHSGLIDDVIGCGGQSFKTPQFSIRDCYGSLVDMQGGGVSFSILFAQGR